MNLKDEAKKHKNEQDNKLFNSLLEAAKREYITKQEESMGYAADSVSDEVLDRLKENGVKWSTYYRDYRGMGLRKYYKFVIDEENLLDKEVKDFKTFAFEHYPNLEGQYNLSLLSDEQLIGKKIVSIKSGFSGLAGTKCYISSIEPNLRNDLKDDSNYDRINFKGRDEFENKNELGWQVLRKDLYTSVKLDEK